MPVHFDALDHLEQWLASEVWNRLILKVQHLEDGDQVEIKIGLEFWFRPPDSEQKRSADRIVRRTAAIGAPPGP